MPANREKRKNKIKIYKKKKRGRNLDDSEETEGVIKCGK